MIDCPACRAPMTQESLRGHLGTPVTIDICFACHAFWFDDRESLQLSPGSTLQLFRTIGEQAAGPRTATPADRAVCPHCGLRLVLVNDLQRATRFQYRRCPRRHGRFTTFFDFLREKNFIQPLSGEQIAELRRHVRAVNCSNCGASVDLTHRSACEHCGSALSMLDFKAAHALVEQLRAADRAGQPIDPAMALNLERARRDVEASFDAMTRTGGRPQWIGDVSSNGLIGAGLAAIARWMRG
jgi:hypothetical protein